MAESKHDDLADALARLAGGDIAPSENEPPAPPAHVTRPPPAPIAPARSALPIQSISPVSPPAPRVTTPRATGLPPGPVNSGRPERPAAPAVRNPGSARGKAAGDAKAPAASARPQRPSVPTLRHAGVESSELQQSPTDLGQSTGLFSNAESTEIFDDEDAMIMLPPEPSGFIAKPKNRDEIQARKAEKKLLEFRRTLIPVLLTVGVLMFFFAGIKFCLGPDSPLSTLPIWVPMMLVVAGCVLLALAVVNILSVKAQLAGRQGAGNEDRG